MTSNFCYKIYHGNQNSVSEHDAINYFALPKKLIIYMINARILQVVAFNLNIQTRCRELDKKYGGVYHTEPSITE